MFEKGALAQRKINTQEKNRRGPGKIPQRKHYSLRSDYNGVTFTMSN